MRARCVAVIARLVRTALVAGKQVHQGGFGLLDESLEPIAPWVVRLAGRPTHSRIGPGFVTSLLCLARHGGYSNPVARFAACALVSACALAGACSYYDASLLEARGSAGSDAGAAEASLDAFVPDGDAPSDALGDEPLASESSTCGHASPPDPPAVQNCGGSIGFVAAMHSVDFADESGEPLNIGYDLDMRCTCSGEPNGCKRVWATEEACDGPDGRDNTGGQFIKAVSSLFATFGAASWNESLHAGAWGMVVRVLDYNGEEDDDRVRTQLYVPRAYYHFQDGGKDPPKWDGTDEWPIRSTSLQDPGDGGTWDVDKPLYSDEFAYVNGGVLVASVSQGTMQVDENFAIEFTGAFLTARIVKGAGDQWSLEDGVLATRWRLANMLAQLSNVDDPLFGSPVCTDNAMYATAKAKICGYADMYAGVGTPTTPCDSLSLAMRFDATPARLGEVVVSSPNPPRCDPAVDPANDSCDTP